MATKTEDLLDAAAQAQPLGPGTPEGAFLQQLHAARTRADAQQVQLHQSVPQQTFFDLLMQMIHGASSYDPVRMITEGK